MPVVIDDYIPPIRPAVYPPAPPGTPPSAGGGATNIPPNQHWVPGTAGVAATAGYTPDYQALYHASPEYLAWHAGAEKRIAGFGENRAEATRRLLVQLGIVPPNFQDAYGDVRAEDIAAAGANQFSTEAGIQRAYEQGVFQMQRALAARGMLQSGDLGYGQNQQELQRGQNESDAFSAFLAAIGANTKEYSGNVSNVLAEETPLIGQVMPGIVEANPATPGTEAVAPTPGHWESNAPTRTAAPTTRPPKTIYAEQPQTAKKATTRTAYPTTRRTTRRP